jgi:hypothetical protein
VLADSYLISSSCNYYYYIYVCTTQALPLTALLPLVGTEGGAAAIARDVFDHLAESAAHLLSETIQSLHFLELEEGEGKGEGEREEGEDDNMQQQQRKKKKKKKKKKTTKASGAFADLAEAAWWLEVVAAHDPGHALRVQRNLGLAYSHMLRLRTPPTASHTLLQLGSGDYHQDLFRDVARNVTAWYDPWRAGGGDGGWRPWAGGRLLEAWRSYLARSSADDAMVRERDYDRIKVKQMYELAMAEFEEEEESGPDWGEGGAEWV